MKRPPLDSPTGTRVVGTYAMDDGNSEHRQTLITSILRSGLCTGLEIPFLSAQYGDCAWLWPLLPAQSRHVFTMVTATMERIGSNPEFGLASTNAQGRREALTMMRHVAETIRWLHSSSPLTIAAVEIHSAPSGGSIEALYESMATMAQWDWAGAALVIEHCDAAVPDHEAVKGFLPLHEEVRLIDELRGTATTALAITINWARSAIEFRDPDAVSEHIRYCDERGVLGGLMYSGTSAVSGPYGSAWSDTHAPMQAEQCFGEPASALTNERLSLTRRAAGNPLLYDGVKMAIRPADAPLERRYAYLEYALRRLQAASALRKEHKE